MGVAQKCSALIYSRKIQNEMGKVMVENPRAANQAPKPRPPSRQTEVLQSLIPVTAKVVNEQYASFVTRICEAFMSCAERGADAKQTNFCFRANNLLKSKGTAYLGLVLQAIGASLLQEVSALEHGVKNKVVKIASGLSLVSYDEMETKVLMASFARPFDIKFVDQLAALNIRLAFLLERDQISNVQNPFRPEVFLAAFRSAWAHFDSETDSDQMLLPFLREDIFIDLGPVYLAVNSALKARAILPGSIDSRRAKLSDVPAPTVAPLPASAFAADPNALPPLVLSQQLRRLFERDTGHGSAYGGAHGAVTGSAHGVAPQGGFASAGQGFAPASAAPSAPDAGFSGQSNASVGTFVPDASAIHDFGMQAAAASKQLFSFLADLQGRVGMQAGNVAHVGAQGESSFATGFQLPMIKEQAPKGALSRIDETTIDLLARVFETVLIDRSIPQEVKQLVSLLQIPVLKAALTDKEFFYQEDHPARRLIELLTQISIGWEQRQVEADDPMYQAMQRSVGRIQKESDLQVSHFTEVVSELEDLIKDDDQATVNAISTPISEALRQEKLVQANKTAKSEIALRVVTGEVAAFVETFLENKWVSVLTLAYSVMDEKPEAVKSATKTMDDLIWSVKPKITAQERKELISKLPTMLAMLNKWLNVVKWDDAERLQFFAELAETHASIVRAPLELSPERQLEIAVTVAKQAAERRMQKTAAQKVEVEPVYDESNETVERLQRGMWLEFSGKEMKDGSESTKRKLKLAWISPMRTLFIFSAGQKQETFSVSAEQLAQQFRDSRVHVLRTTGLVTSALTQAVAGVPMNDAAVKQFA